MTYQIIENFAAGLDIRKSPLTSPAGTLTKLVNAVITPGGEIAKRRAFVQVADLTNTFGLAATESKLIVFGRGAPPSSVPTLPAALGLTLWGLGIPNAATDLTQTDYDVFDGKIYLSCSQPSASGGNSKNPHYYHSAGTAGTNLVLTNGAGKGFYVRTYQSKVYAILGQYLNFCAVGDPTKWEDTATGAGNINLSMQDADSELLTSLEVYYDKLAIFSTEAIQIWAVDPDDAQNAFVQLLRGTGTGGPRSPLQYGNGDVLYLDASGIRSLKAKDSSNSASVSDIGSPVDPTVQTMLLGQGTAYMNKAIALLEPSIGRFWMVFPTQILVLSYFPGPSVTAWSQFTLPFTVQHAVTAGGKIFFRDTADKLWVYGGVDGLAYENCGVEVRLPYLDGKKPGHKKMFEAIDATVTGTWRVAISYDFNNPDAEETVDTISQPSWNVGAHEMQGYDSHFSLRFYNNDALPATISNAAVHYEMADAEA